ncbi:MAG: xanthine dehydrogenase family protein molybdopterin-binding subunit [Hyphomicrobiaceae bacterium]
MTHSSLTDIFKLSVEAALGQPLASAQSSRRSFLKLSGAGLVLGLAAPQLDGPALAAPAANGLAADAFVRIAPDNTVTVIIKHLDKGQGAATGLATLVAEELDAGWAQIKTEFAPSDPVRYKNLAFGIQGVGGSSGLSNSYEQYRRAGATARAMIVAAAAKEWGVAVREVVVSNGVVSIKSGKTATLGAMADAAAKQAVPSKVTLKTPDKFVFIGKAFPRVDSRAKTNGTAKFTFDLQMPDMLVAVMARPPKFGATVASYYATAAEKTPGVVAVVKVPQGVAVLAKSTWAAIKGRDALKVSWDESKAETRSTADIIGAYKALLDKPGTSARKDGDAEAALAKAAKVVSADFEFPYLAHAPMETLDCVVRSTGSSAEVWTGSQMQTLDHGAACSVLGLKPEAVQLHTVWAGGSFGRRAITNSHFVAEACEIAKAYGKPVPIKVIWTREDDIKGGYYRPIYLHRVRAGLDTAGNVVAWHHRIVGQSILAGTPFEGQMVKGGIDATSVEGASTLPYAIPNLSVELHSVTIGVPVLWWRSVGATHTAHATEHMMDLLAKEAGKDPVAFRLALLKDKPRHAGALKLAAEKAGWGSPVPPGTTRGVALHESFQSYVAQIADVALKPDGSFKVVRVVSAIDCGIAVNPDVVHAQMEGGIGFGLGAALRGEITLKGGNVEQANFDTYAPLRMSDMPKVESYIVPSAEAPTGVGEPGTPVVLPAVANALFSATGQRTLRLPMTKQIYKGT